MSLAETHLMWRDAVPATSFPFRFHDRHHGVITQSWADVKEKLGRDALCTALAFAPSHLAPSQLQNRIVDEMNKKEALNARKLEAMRRERDLQQQQQQRSLTQRPKTASTITTARARDAVIAARAARDVEEDPSCGAPDELPQEQQLTEKLVPPRRPLSAHERRVLAEGDGDGARCRDAFLRLRRRLPVQHRTTRRQTTSQQYGWEQLDFTDRAVNPNAQETALQRALGQRVGGAQVPEYVASRSAAAAARANSLNSTTRKSNSVGSRPGTGDGGGVAGVVTGSHRATPANRPQSAYAASRASRRSSGDPAAANRASTTPAASTPALADGAAADDGGAMKVTVLGTLVPARPGGQREPGEAGAYYGKRSFMRQLSRRTGVFARGD